MFPQKSLWIGRERGCWEDWGCNGIGCLLAWWWSPFSFSGKCHTLLRITCTLLHCILDKSSSLQVWQFFIGRCF
jgi:hypothetical protein